MMLVENTYFRPFLVFCWFILPQIVTNTIYTYNSTVVEYEEAKNMCQQKGLVLVSPATLKLHIPLSSFLLDNSIVTSWIGLKLPESSSRREDFLWESGSTYSSYWDNWHDNEPDFLETDKCVVIDTIHMSQHGNGPGWRTRNCGNKYSYICQGQPTPPSQFNPDSSNVGRTDRGDCGMNYVLQQGMTVIGEYQQTVFVRSLIECAVVCSNHVRCDRVIRMKNEGRCELYWSVSPLMTGNNVTDTNMTDGGKIYRIE